MDKRFNLSAYLSPQEASQCGQGQTGKRRCRWLDGQTCLAVAAIRQGRHGNSIKPPRGEDGQSLCPQGIGVGTR